MWWMLLMIQDVWEGYPYACPSACACLWKENICLGYEREQNTPRVKIASWSTISYCCTALLYSYLLALVFLFIPATSPIPICFYHLLSTFSSSLQAFLPRYLQDGILFCLHFDLPRLTSPNTLIQIFPPINHKWTWFCCSNFTGQQRKIIFCFSLFPCCFLLLFGLFVFVFFFFPYMHDGFF